MYKERPQIERLDSHQEDVEKKRCRNLVRLTTGCIVIWREMTILGTCKHFVSAVVNLSTWHWDAPAQIHNSVYNAQNYLLQWQQLGSTDKDQSNLGPMHFDH